MTAAILAQIAAMPLPEPHVLGSDSDDGRHHYTADQLRAARLEAAQMVFTAFLPVNAEMLAALKWVREYAADDSLARWTAVDAAISSAEAASKVAT